MNKLPESQRERDDIDLPSLEVDAWKQDFDLHRKFTQEWEPRPDLRVTAHALGRCVEVEIGKFKHDAYNVFDPPGKPSGKMNWRSAGKRSVSTLREFAQAIVDACDFVDQSNPTWAGHRSDGLVDITAMMGDATDDTSDRCCSTILGGAHRGDPDFNYGYPIRCVLNRVHGGEHCGRVNNGRAVAW